jgi:26S proteasome regulatory subunit N5
MTSTSTLLTLITRLAYEQSAYDTLNQQLVIMSKKHGQLKEAVTRMVDEAMKWLPVLKAKKEQGEFKKDAKDRWFELLTTLRDITEGKVS